MSFVHESNKNNRKDTKRDEFAWHSKLLTNRLRFICLFVNVNELVKKYIINKSTKSKSDSLSDDNVTYACKYDIADCFNNFFINISKLLLTETEPLERLAMLTIISTHSKFIVLQKRTLNVITFTGRMSTSIILFVRFSIS